MQFLRDLFYEEWVTLGLFQNEMFKGFQVHAVSKQDRKQLLGILLSQGVKPQLGVVGLVSPVMAILGTIIHQQQDASRCKAFAQEIEKRLRLVIQPVQILKDEDKGLVEALAHQQPFDSLKRAPSPDLRV